MVTVAGTDAALGLELLRLTVIGPGPAGNSNWTVAVVDVPPLTELGETLTDFGGIGLTVTIAVLERPFSAAVTVGLVTAETAPDSIVNV